MVKLLIVLVSTISYSQVFLLKKKNVRRFCKCKYISHFSSKKKISVYAIFNDQSFNDRFTNDMVSFKQLGLGCWSIGLDKSGFSLEASVRCF